MKSTIFCLLLCVICFKSTMGSGAPLYRSKRSGGSSSNSGSYSSSSSSSSSYGGGTGHGGVGAGNFNFPTQGNYPYNPYPFPGGAPFYDFNFLFQQFLASFNAAQALAAQNQHYAAIFQQQLNQLMAQQQAAAAAAAAGAGQYPGFTFPGFDTNTIPGGSGSSYGSGYSSGGVNSVHSGSSGSYPGSGYSSGAVPGGANSVHTGASVSYGPQGGYGTASSVPGGPDGLGVRISEEFPAPASGSSGGSFGTFSSSSSGVSSVNGKTTSYKTSTFGTNDNGKITFRTINE